MLIMIMWAGAVALAQGTLGVSEVLYQPRSGEAEYVELYNLTATAVDIADYEIIRWVGDSLGTHYPLPSHTVAPHDYVVLTKDATSVAANYDVKYPGKLVECQLPTYPNDGGAVVLAMKDGPVVEQFFYRPDMHSALLRNKAGVALERRSFEKDCNEAGNWFSAASTAGYGTPGYENSQSREWLAEETAFELSSKHLSPDRDGYEDVLTLSYRLDTEDVYADIIVFDAAGMRVKRLLNNALLGSHGEVVWDGRGEGGTSLPQGRYVMIINLHDLHGTRQEMKRTVAIVY